MPSPPIWKIHSCGGTTSQYLTYKPAFHNSHLSCNILGLFFLIWSCNHTADSTTYKLKLRLFYKSAYLWVHFVDFHPRCKPHNIFIIYFFDNSHLLKFLSFAMSNFSYCLAFALNLTSNSTAVSFVFSKFSSFFHILYFTINSFTTPSNLQLPFYIIFFYLLFFNFIYLN